jgi:hypothetical protein
VRDTNFIGTEQATRIKSDPGATGFLCDVLYSNLRMQDVGSSIFLTMFYPDPDPTKITTLVIGNITFRDIVSHNSACAGQFDCDAASPCEGLLVQNVSHTGAAPKRWTCAAAHGQAVDVSHPLCLQP